MLSLELLDPSAQHAEVHPASRKERLPAGANLVDQGVRRDGGAGQGGPLGQPRLGAIAQALQARAST
jgi:hypothetical protein